MKISAKSIVWHKCIQKRQSFPLRATAQLREGDTFPVENIEIVKYADVPPGTCNIMPEETAVEANHLYLVSTIGEAYTLVKNEMVPFFKTLKKPIVRDNMGEKEPNVATYVPMTTGI